MEKPAKILIIRNDRIGDLVLSLPALEILRRKFPEAKISLLCSEYASPIVRGNPNIDRLLTGKPAHDESDFYDLLQDIKNLGADAAVTMVHSWKNLKLLKESGIPLRVGPWVKLTAPLYLNRPVRQHRSSAAKHEAQYNVDLLAPLGVKRTVAPPAVIDVGSDLRIWAEDHLDVEFSGFSPKPIVVIHPGMGGSALNWPEHHWAALTRMLAESGFFRVILSGGPGENALLDRVSAGFANILPVRKFLGRSLSEMMGILAVSSFVVAPSTGPLHVASALGVPVAGIYSPIREQCPERWGPYGVGTSRTFAPKHYHENCMAEVDPVEVYAFLESNLAGFSA